MKNFLCGILLASVVLLALGNSRTQSDAGQYQMVSSYTQSDVFVLDTVTGELFRYAFANSRTIGARAEAIFVESFGPPKEPRHEDISTLSGKEWPSGYSY